MLPRKRVAVDIRAGRDSGVLSTRETIIVVDSRARTADRGVSNPGDFQLHMPTTGMGHGTASIELLDFRCPATLSPIPIEDTGNFVQMVASYTRGALPPSPESFTFPVSTSTSLITDYTLSKFAADLTSLASGLTFALSSTAERQLYLSSTLYPVTFDLRDADPSDPVNHIYRMMGIPFGETTQFLDGGPLPLPADLTPWAKSLYLSVDGCTNPVRTISTAGGNGASSTFVIPVPPTRFFLTDPSDSAPYPAPDSHIHWEPSTDSQRQAATMLDPEGLKRFRITDHVGRPLYCTEAMGAGRLMDWAATFKVTYGC